MSNVKARVHQILERPEEGDTANKVVNGLLLALIAIVVIIVLGFLGDNITAVFQRITDELGALPAG